MSQCSDSGRRAPSVDARAPGPPPVRPPDLCTEHIGRSGRSRRPGARRYAPFRSSFSPFSGADLFLDHDRSADQSSFAFHQAFIIENIK